MSAPTSTNSQVLRHSSAEIADPGPFEGTDKVVFAWRQGLRPDPHLTVSEWADRYRVLASRASAEPGRYRTSRTPYMRAILDALSPGKPWTIDNGHTNRADLPAVHHGMTITAYDAERILGLPDTQILQHSNP